MTREELIELFRRTSDCFAQTIDESKLAAMTEERFVEVVLKILAGKQEEIEPTVWMAGPAAGTKEFWNAQVIELLTREK